jgi:hypothetical protein
VFVMPSTRDAIYLAFLAGGCTLLPFALSLVALRHVSAFTAIIALNTIVLLGEQRELTPSFYLGVAIVLAAVFLHPLLVRRPSVAVAAGPRGPDTTG